MNEIQQGNPPPAALPFFTIKYARNNELSIGEPYPIRMIRAAFKSHNDLVYKRGRVGGM